MTQFDDSDACCDRLMSEAPLGLTAESLLHIHGASGIADTVMRRAILFLEEGVSEELHAARIGKTLESLGAMPSGTTVCVAFGANTADPLHVPDETELAEGDAVSIRFGCRLHEAPAVAARTVFFGQVDEAQRVAYGAVCQAFQESFSFAVDGNCVGAVFEKIEAYLAEALPEADIRFDTRFDCGEGALPVLTAADADTVLDVGMLVLVDVTASMPGRLGIRLASLVLIEEDGCEVLSRYPIAMSVLDTGTRGD